MTLRTFILHFSVILLMFSCGNKNEVPLQQEPKKTAQWINPLFYNNDFEGELNFPLWFNDSLVRAHKIYKITKRIYPRFLGDTTEINSLKQAIPKEKIEYYFDPNGLVDQLVVYFYFDDREISRAYFKYEGNMMASGYRKVNVLPFISFAKQGIKDDFTTELFQDKTNQYSFLDFLLKRDKYSSYLDVEKRNHLFILKDRKYWGVLSVDSILHPTKEDWIVHGSMRKPYKRYHIDNIVKESMVHTFNYWKSGVINHRIKQNYPFEYKRSFIYNRKNQWIKYLDSTFSDGKFITSIENKIFYDQYERPIEISHYKKSDGTQNFFYIETLHYRTLNKNN